MRRGHKNSHNDLTPEFIREVFDYDRDTGILRWKKTLSRRAPAGKAAGTMDDQGRIKIGIAGKDYFAHRIAWVWMTGQWPSHEIDHKNQIKADNRWQNLREATSSENHRNRDAPKNNKSGYKGVCFASREQAWLATINIRIDGKKKHIHIGYFDTPEEAAKAYQIAAKKIHGKDWVPLSHHTRP